MGDPRSQQILRLPRDQTPAVLTMHDGERAHVMLFVPPGDTISHVLDGQEPFVPVSYSTGTRLVARAAIACITVREPPRTTYDDDLPLERQRAVVRLRAGSALKGELRWTAPAGRRRTLDHLNDGAQHLVVHDGDETVYISKAHIVAVIEEG